MPPANGTGLPRPSSIRPRDAWLVGRAEALVRRRNGGTIYNLPSFRGRAGELLGGTLPFHAPRDGPDLAVVDDEEAMTRLRPIVALTVLALASASATMAGSYRKSPNPAAGWDVYTWIMGEASNVDSEARPWPVPNGTRLVAILNDDLSAHNARKGDRFTLTIRSPSQYRDAVILAFVTRVNRGGRLSVRSGMFLAFESIRLRDGSRHDFDGVIESIRTPDGETIAVDDEGTVDRVSRTDGAVQPGAVGAATVIFEGRDRLELQRGMEVTILSGSRSRRLITHLGDDDFLALSVVDDEADHHVHLTLGHGALGDALLLDPPDAEVA